LKRSIGIKFRGDEEVELKGVANQRHNIRVESARPHDGQFLQKLLLILLLTECGMFWIRVWRKEGKKKLSKKNQNTLEFSEQLTLDHLEGKANGPMLANKILVKKYTSKYCRSSSRTKRSLNSKLFCRIKQQKSRNRNFWSGFF